VGVDDDGGVVDGERIRLGMGHDFLSPLRFGSAALSACLDRAEGQTKTSGAFASTGRLFLREHHCFMARIADCSK
jgi:hypothetical protein